MRYIASSILNWLSSVPESDALSELMLRERIWIRDRLWLIRAHLGEADASLLAELIGELGEPARVDFLAYSGPWRARSTCQPDDS